MKIIDKQTNLFKSGPASVDYTFYAQYTIENTDGSIVYCFLYVPPFEGSFYSASKKSPLEPDFDGKFISFYRNINRAKKSPYYEVFTEMSKKIDEYIENALEELDDTSFFYGYRYGTKLSSSGIHHYGESAVGVDILNDNIYVQIDFCNDAYTYSITDRSVFLRMDLGDMYECYYPNKEYKELFKSTSLDDLGEYMYLKVAFDDLTSKLKSYINQLITTKKDELKQ